MGYSLFSVFATSVADARLASDTCENLALCIERMIERELKTVEKSMNGDVAKSPTWNDLKDTPEARDAVSKMEAHYTPIVIELRQDIADKDQVINDQKAQIDALIKTSQLQRWFIIGSCLGMAIYLWFG